jgi:hypothetical protein
MQVPVYVQCLFSPSGGWSDIPSVPRTAGRVDWLDERLKRMIGYETGNAAVIWKGDRKNAAGRQRRQSICC